jgi:hypothetical protein
VEARVRGHRRHRRALRRDERVRRAPRCSG